MKCVRKLDKEKQEKSLTELINERAIEMLGLTLDEKSDDNIKWMQEKGYQIKVKRKLSRKARKGRY